ncbi:pyrroline-5-carboxylate reductase [Plasmodium inui San Antonio 1]|uniref:Pyrroline-5-carboxylate reductase n=1 Tax=Plasmodium inui San Antonio 1 TaxID=1237626 RepID=W7A6B5_9APIC|nr:pyrroline-5-carboxylate reductase [Plasmodium inui San Antonio 1]EUD68667.1 pyrroline-5-carboxylate reductase [Plasmodium inui San Antonio 1]
MGSPLAYGIQRSKLIGNQNIYYHTPGKKEVPFHYLESNEVVVKTCDIIVLAVKPDVAAKVLLEIRQYASNKLLISICGGLNLKTLEEMVGVPTKIVRIMPNTPSLVGQGCLVFCGNIHVDARDTQKVIDIFSACGVIQEIKEANMDIATAISGCGPAYIFLFIESLIDAGVKNGLNRDVAKNLVLQTILGSIHLVKASSQPIQQLKDDVCTPHGISIAGLCTLEKHAFKYAVMDAVESAYKKSKSMH